MKIFIPVLFLATVLAEPPVGDGYPAARSYHNHEGPQEHHASDYQRSLSQEYGLPSFTSSRNALSMVYGVPNARSALSSQGQSPKNGAPAARVSFNQRFRSSAPRNSQDNIATAKSLSQEYGVPSTRNGIPTAQSPSQEYGAPSIVSARTLSTEYGVPVTSARSNKMSHSQASSFRSATPAKASSQDYSAPSTFSQFSNDPLSSGFNAPSARSNDISRGYEAPIQSARSSFGSRSPPQTHLAKSIPSSTYSNLSSRSLSTFTDNPSPRNANSHSQDFNSFSATYDAPSQRDLSGAYEIPDTRGLPQEYGVPSSRTNLMTNAIASSYPAASSRSSPSQTYLPASRTAMPSEQYGVPEQRDSQGYDYARARESDELLNQEPASYDFAYQIEDAESGSDFGHTETREDNRAEGSYFVVLPDGTKQTVEYEADERGYQPRISVEPASSGGYDENAADIRTSEEGPY